MLRQKNKRQDYAWLLAANDNKIAEWPMPFLYNLHPRLIVLVFQEALPFVMKKMAPRKKCIFVCNKKGEAMRITLTDAKRSSLFQLQKKHTWQPH